MNALNLPAILYAAARHELGDAVGEQLEAVGNGAPIEEQNPAALTICYEWICKHASDIAEHITEDTCEQLHVLMDRCLRHEDRNRY